MTLTGTERKRTWRLRNPERSQAAERERAQARRNGYWGTTMNTLKPCLSHESYYRYEHTTGLFNRYTKRLKASIDAKTERLAVLKTAYPELYATLFGS